MQGDNLSNHNMKVLNGNIVTASVESDTTEAVGTVPVAPPYPSSPGKGMRCGGPTKLTPAIAAFDIDNGQISVTLAPNQTLTQLNTLRLRGGGNDEHDSDMELDTENQDITNSQKRFKSNSPEITQDKTTDTIMEALNQIDTTLAGIRTYMADMIISTKIGKKWAGGIENFLSEILISTKKIALEAVEVVGVNKNIAIELRETKRQIYDLHVMIGEQTQLDKGPSPRKTYAVATSIEKSQAATDMTPVKGRTEFPPIDQTVKKPSKPKANRNRQTQKLDKAKKLPVKPTLIIKGSSGIDSVWKAVREKVPKPKIDNCKKTREWGHTLINS